MLGELECVWHALLGTCFTWSVTAAGAAMVFLLPSRAQSTVLDVSLGFAGGVMLAASYWSLLAPSQRLAEESGGPVCAPLAAGVLAGALFVHGADQLLVRLGVGAVGGHTFLDVAEQSPTTAPPPYPVSSAAGSSDWRPETIEKNGDVIAECREINGDVEIQFTPVRRRPGHHSHPPTSHPPHCCCPACSDTSTAVHGLSNGSHHQHQQQQQHHQHQQQHQHHHQQHQQQQQLEEADDKAVGLVLGLGSARMGGPAWRRLLLMVIAVTVHNIPEGLAVGVAFAAAAKPPPAPVTFSGACRLALSIGLQNFPEGMAVSVPLHAAGLPLRTSFWYGQLSGMVEPVFGVLGALMVSLLQPLLPYALSFAAGAMIFVVIDDIVPDSHSRGRGRLSSWCFMTGFLLMLCLDVGLG